MIACKWFAGGGATSRRSEVTDLPAAAEAPPDAAAATAPPFSARMSDSRAAMSGLSARPPCRVRHRRFCASDTGQGTDASGFECNGGRAGRLKLKAVRCRNMAPAKHRASWHISPCTEVHKF